MVRQRYRPDGVRPHVLPTYWNPDPPPETPQPVDNGCMVPA